MEASPATLGAVPPPAEPDEPRDSPEDFEAWPEEDEHTPDEPEESPDETCPHCDAERNPIYTADGVAVCAECKEEL